MQAELCRLLHQLVNTGHAGRNCPQALQVQEAVGVCSALLVNLCALFGLVETGPSSHIYMHTVAIQQGDLKIQHRGLQQQFAPQLASAGTVRLQGPA